MPMRPGSSVHLRIHDRIIRAGISGEETCRNWYNNYNAFIILFKALQTIKLEVLLTKMLQNQHSSKFLFVEMGPSRGQHVEQ